MLIRSFSRFAKRAAKQNAFYSIRELMCFFGMRKSVATMYAIRLLETPRFRDRAKRRSMLRQLPNPKLTIPPETAAIISNADAIEGLRELRKAAMAIVERNRDYIEQVGPKKIEELRQMNTAPNLQILRIVRNGSSYSMDNVRDYRDIFSALAHPDLISIAANYLGAAPVLLSVALVYTPQNEWLQGSQIFHAHDSFDYQRPKEIGIVMNLSDVTPESGPFTYIPADKGLSAIRDKNLWQGTRITDEDLFAKIGNGTEVLVTGEPGATLFVDGSRCIHQGARARKGDRTVLIAFYSLPNLAGLPSACMYAMSNKALLQPKTKLELLLLRL